jgi:hypothetical protein
MDCYGPAGAVKPHGWHVIRADLLSNERRDTIKREIEIDRASRKWVSKIQAIEEAMEIELAQIHAKWNDRDKYRYERSRFRRMSGARYVIPNYRMVSA